MFTGIIEETGAVDAVIKGSGTYKLRIKCRKILGGADDPTKIGDSIAVNGICLTVTEISGSAFTADVMPETLSRTSLEGCAPGTPVDLERAMPADGRFGGHIVSGHIDGTGRITRKYKDGNAVWFEIETDPAAAALIVEKGSIAVDGISLTVAGVSGNSFKVSVIPHTLGQTVLDTKEPGSVVNLETDIVGKYVKKLLGEKGAEGNGGNEKDDEETDGSDLLSLLY